MSKTVSFDKNIIEPEIKRTCECAGCCGCSFLPCASAQSPIMWTSFRCKNVECKNYVCLYCIDYIDNEKKYCNYCLRK